MRGLPVSSIADNKLNCVRRRDKVATQPRQYEIPSVIAILIGRPPSRLLESNSSVQEGPDLKIATLISRKTSADGIDCCRMIRSHLSYCVGHAFTRRQLRRTVGTDVKHHFGLCHKDFASGQRGISHYDLILTSSFSCDGIPNQEASVEITVAVYYHLRNQAGWVSDV